jgi:hypothetical protein
MLNCSLSPFCPKLCLMRTRVWGLSLSIVLLGSVSQTFALIQDNWG